MNKKVVAVVKKKSPEELKEAIEQYFAKFPNIEDNLEDNEYAEALRQLNLGIKPTLSGLAYKIGLTDVRQFETLRSVPKLRCLIDSTYLRLYRYWEAGLATGKGSASIEKWLKSRSSGVLVEEAKPQELAPKVAVIVIGADGSKQTLSSIIEQTQANTSPQRVVSQAVKVIGKPSK